MSASPSIQQNLISADPDLRVAFDMLIKEIFLSFNCHALATIKSFNPDKQSATATVNYKKTIFVQDPITLAVTPKLITYSPLVDCPVYVNQGGGGSLTFPISAGDQAEVHFNDRDMDNWIASAIVGPSATPRMHAFSDAILYVGVNPFPMALANYDTVRALLSLGTSKVGVGPAGVLISANDVKLSTVLNDLLTALTTFVGVLGALTPPATPVLNSVLQVPGLALETALEAVSLELAEVLE